MKTYCSKLWNELYIDKDGETYSCCRNKPLSYGNINEQKLSEIYKNPLLIEQRKRSLEGLLDCYQNCTLINKEKNQFVTNRLSTPYQSLKKLKILFGELCNIACVMCHQDHRDRKQLNANVLKRNIDLKPFKKIDLQGGEPLAQISAKIFFEHAASLNKNVCFMTNALLINEEWAEKIATTSKSIYVSINASTKKTHEIVNKGSKWEKVLKNIKTLHRLREQKQQPLLIFGHMTLVEPNLHEIPDFINNFQKLGFDGIHFGYDASTVPNFLLAHRVQTLMLKIKISFALLKQKKLHSQMNLEGLKALNLI